MKKIISFITSEITVIIVVMINAVALIASSSLPDADKASIIWKKIDFGCIIFFIIEALLKIKTLGWKGYWRNGWNKFDFIIVVFSLPVLFESILDTSGFGILLIMRLGRLLRLMRLMKFIPNREHLIGGITRAMKASVGVFFTLLIVNIILSSGATILFAQYAPEHFGNPFLSLYSMFKVFTVEGWYEIPDLIAQKTSVSAPIIASVARIYFVITVILGGILGLSLANAVFIDEMTMDNTKEMERKIDVMAQEIHELKSYLMKTEDIPNTGSAQQTDSDASQH